MRAFTARILTRSRSGAGAVIAARSDRSAADLLARFCAHFGKKIGLIIIDSWGRAWRRGTVGVAIGVAGPPALKDLRGCPDLFGPRVAGHANRLCRRYRRSSIAPDGAGRRRLARRPGARAPLVRVDDACRRADPLPGRGLVPVTARRRSARSSSVRRHNAPRRGVVAVCGVVIGGAKLALGLARVLPGGDLVAIRVNTGDDFEHLGLAISPDIDTVMYTLAGLDDPQRGWGRRDETWTFMFALASLGGETWFRLGDGDLAVHIERTRRLRAGDTLSAITADFCRALGIAARICPMSDDPVRTRLDTDRGRLDFQDYFVRHACAPVVSQVTYEGARTAGANADALAALRDRSLRAV